MKKEALLEQIKQFARPCSFKELADLGEVHQSTVARWLHDWVQKGVLLKQKKGRNVFYSISTQVSAKEYLSQEVFLRKPVLYNPDFLREYDEETNSILGDAYKLKIKPIVQSLSALETADYQKNRRGIETILIDLSYQGSKMEGNTYSYLDTEVLIKYNQASDTKTQEETTMVINHKNAIQYLLEYRKELGYERKTFRELHTLLARGLIEDHYLGVFRDTQVEMGGSAYQPLEAGSLMESEFDLFLEKLNQIRNPFEQSIFILTFIPYFQAFIDINKRTSRISANIPLIKAGYPVISLLQTKPRVYIDAILAIYELNDTSLLVDIFVNNYILNAHRYVTPEQLDRIKKAQLALQSSQ